MGVPARSAADRLRAAMKDPVPAVRVQAALALWRVARDADLASAVLYAALKDADNKDRWEAVEVVGILAVEAAPREEPCEALLKASKDRDPAARVQALAWLFRVRGKARQTALLRAAVADRDVSVRLMAVEALGETGAEGEILGPLLPALEDKDVSVRLAAEEALARGGKRMTAQLIAGLSEPSPRTRAAMARALGMIGPDAKRAVEPLLRVALEKKPVVKEVVYEALLRISCGRRDEVTQLWALNEQLADLIEILETIEEEQCKFAKMLEAVFKNGPLRQLFPRK
jgi:HEAT repeat protein